MTLIAIPPLIYFVFKLSGWSRFLKGEGLGTFLESLLIIDCKGTAKILPRRELGLSRIKKKFKINLTQERW
jgi:hypothetical protein